MAYTNEDLVSAELGGFTLSSSSTPSSDDIAIWIGQAKAEIDSRSGETFEPIGVTQELYDWNHDDNILRLKNSNVLSITTFEYNDQNAGETPSWTSKTEDTDFYLQGDYGEVEFITSNFSPIAGKRRFRVTYTHGQTSVPKDVQMLATKIVAKRVIDSVISSQASVAGGAVSVGTISVDDASNFSPTVSKQLKAEIDSLFDKIIGSFKTYRPIREY